MKCEYKAYPWREGSMNVLIWSPEEMTAPLPCILFLHGSGERGDDPALLAVQALPKYLTAGYELPAIVVCPQCPEEEKWYDKPAMLEGVLQDVCARYPVDESRLSVTGISMGGFGTWQCILDLPGRFFRAAPICGGGPVERAGELKTQPIWAFHGTNDQAVDFSYSENMVNAVNAQGGDAFLAAYPGVGHLSWDLAYQQSDLIPWLLGEDVTRK